ncbi:hypothetical protein [Novosphingobium sp. P6W]|uniref:hypothetical protein n=1 Tax=Novosphingobium sp. P6W TaxID=1609758 RepID=UPI000A76F900|nr:hypothetical protein [Novosphingobium sp. P6W]
MHEAVESGIAVFEEEFLADIVVPNGRTIGEETRPLIAQAYSDGAMANLLLAVGRPTQ